MKRGYLSQVVREALSEKGHLGVERSDKQVALQRFEERAPWVEGTVSAKVSSWEWQVPEAKEEDNSRR